MVNFSLWLSCDDVLELFPADNLTHMRPQFGVMPRKLLIENFVWFCPQIYPKQAFVEDMLVEFEKWPLNAPWQNIKKTTFSQQ